MLRYWKASEFRSHLNYVSPIIMEDCLGKKPYCHYLLYFCGITIFSSAFHKHHWKRASDFINSFVRDYGEIYGLEHLTNNVHNLQHIAQDGNEYGSIDDNSAYDFESFLQTLKLSARSGFRSCVQVASRSTSQVTFSSRLLTFFELLGA